MIQAPERCSQPAQGEDQTELCCAALDDQAETHPPSKCQAVLAFLLHFRERIPGGEANRDDQQFAFGCQILDREDELVITFPSLFRKKGSAGPEIFERRVVCCREFRAPACDQIQFCDALATLDKGDEVGAAVELIDDLKYRLLTFFSGRMFGEENSDAQVSLGTQLLRDQRVGGFLHAVVQEAVGIVRTEDEARSHGFPEMVVHVLGRALIPNPQHLKLCTVAHAGELLEYFLGFWRKALQLPDHQFYNIICEAFGTNSEQVPYPTPRAIIECQQAIVRESVNELDCEERVARGLFVNQVCQWGGALQSAVKGVHKQFT